MGQVKKYNQLFESDYQPYSLSNIINKMIWRDDILGIIFAIKTDNFDVKKYEDDIIEKFKSFLKFDYNNDLIEFVNLLIEHKFDMNKQDEYGLTPIMNAVHSGNCDIVKIILKLKNIDLTIRDKNGDDVFKIYENGNEDELNHINHSNEPYVNKLEFIVKNNFPKVWKDYLKNKQTKKFKI